MFVSQSKNQKDANLSVTISGDGDWMVGEAAESPSPELYKVGLTTACGLERYTDALPATHDRPWTET